MIDDGGYIRQLRKPVMSLRALARTVEVSPVFLSDMEKGRRNIPDLWLGKIAKALEVSRKSLIEGIVREKLRKAEEGERQVTDMELGRPALLACPECGKRYWMVMYPEERQPEPQE